ncbi:MAG: hypothetical protein JWO36_5040 [Myxococcales bacterium]|nr:hypothetical protein [Myxococcales bacterium]
MIERAPVAHRIATPPRAEGCFFRGSGRARFGVVHKPSVRHALGIGLVIVPPFGYEAICTHRSLRHLAEAGARAGLVAVRLDLDGTGDSEGNDLEHGRLDAWLASIADACDLARGSGANRIVLAGVRLGATLASLAAAQRNDVAGVIAIAAVPSGKALVREGRALQMQLALAPAPDGRTSDDVHELVGFALTGETRTALSQIDLVKAQRAPAPAMLIVDRDDLAGNDKWTAALRALGVEVEVQRLPGYVAMVADPHCSEVPHAIVEAAIRFAVTRPALPVTSSAEVIASPRALLGGDVTEDLVELDNWMTGIATRGHTRSERAVILLNAGATYRIGPNRLHVELARRLAARGDLVLRVDLSGLGDSAARPGAAENVVYSDHAIADVGLAVAWARQQGAHKVAVVGLCSGAYHALKAAVDGQLIDTVVPINPLTFFWKPGMPLDFAAFRVTTETARYQKSLASPSSWLKLLRGDVNVVRVARILGERARDVAEHRARDVARRLRVPLTDDLGGELLALGRRDIAMRFIFAGDDPGHSLLVEQAGSALPRLTRTGKLSMHVVAAADHTFTPRWSHGLLLDAISRAVS